MIFHISELIKKNKFEKDQIYIINQCLRELISDFKVSCLENKKKVKHQKKMDFDEDLLET